MLTHVNKKREGLFAFVMILLLLMPFVVRGTIPTIEREALIAIYHRTDGDNWINNNGWKTAPLHTDGFAMPGTEKNWYGVGVTDFGNTNPEDHVYEIYLDKNNLVGTIPVELANLGCLMYCYLNNNQLTGTIPPQLANLPLLDNLYLNNNRLTGTIPIQLTRLNNLSSLLLSANRLTGTIPPELGDMNSLAILYLDYNDLTGTIPPELGNGVLKRLDLSHNHLEGTVPSTLGNLNRVGKMAFTGNSLSGNMSTLIAQWEAGFYPSLSIELDYNAFTFDETCQMEITQTVAPGNVSATGLSSTLVEVSWDPIAFTHGDGGYLIYYSTTSGGPWAYAGTTADKTVSTYHIGGLLPSTTYYVVVKTRSEPNDYNTNTVISSYSAEASAVTGADFSMHTLTIQSYPDSGVPILLSPPDNNATLYGYTPFAATYDDGKVVTLTASLADPGDRIFNRWVVDGREYPTQSVNVDMDGDHTAVAHYIAPSLDVNRSTLNCVCVSGGTQPPAQSVVLDSHGSHIAWTASCDVSWLNVSPASGSGSRIVTVTVDPSALALASGTYNGTITFNAPSAADNPQVTVTMEVKENGSTDGPFGVFATPLNGITVYGSIPVSGWVLDDVGVDSVKIYREDGNDLRFIGDAVFVEGARPDVEADYPDYPLNYRAGWGYMMLTNFLPNSGNGTFKIRAIATDVEGNRVSLGTKTITCDNANAVIPFGAIDTPEQGGIASGNAYINWGWVLAHHPNAIPTDGSTIYVWVDGVKLGNPTYNIYRSDLATLFPGYANSNGAAGYFYLDTTVYENGVHNIHWTAYDDAGNRAGIGSRYFTIQNNASAQSASVSAVADELSREKILQSMSPERISDIPRITAASARYTIKELEPIQLDVFGESFPDTLEGDSQTEVGLTGYLYTGEALKPLPVGSTFDRATGKFSWCPGPGFLGEYRFIFFRGLPGDRFSGREIRIYIEPRFNLTIDSKQ